MKIIRQFIHRLFRGRRHPQSPYPERAAPKTAGVTPDRTARQPERSAFADDDSPPGHKIRWHA
jgi:hypothetical protein